MVQVLLNVAKIGLASGKIIHKGLKAWKKSKRIRDNIKKMRGEKKGFEKLSKKHQDEAYDVSYKKYVKQVEKKKTAIARKNIAAAGRAALYAIAKHKLKNLFKKYRSDSSKYSLSGKTGTSQVKKITIEDRENVH